MMTPTTVLERQAGVDVATVLENADVMAEVLLSLGGDLQTPLESPFFPQLLQAASLTCLLQLGVCRSHGSNTWFLPPLTLFPQFLYSLCYSQKNDFQLISMCFRAKLYIGSVVPGMFETVVALFRNNGLFLEHFVDLIICFQGIGDVQC